MPILGLHSLLFLLSAQTMELIINPLVQSMGELLNSGMFSLSRINILFLFSIFLATSPVFSSAATTLVLLTVLHSYFTLLPLGATLMTAAALFLITKIVNEGFLIRSFFNGIPFVFIFSCGARLFQMWIVSAGFGRALLWDEHLWTIVPSAIADALIAPLLFSLIEWSEARMSGEFDESIRPARLKRL